MIDSTFYNIIKNIDRIKETDLYRYPDFIIGRLKFSRGRKKTYG